MQLWTVLTLSKDYREINLQLFKHLSSGLIFHTFLNCMIEKQARKQHSQSENMSLKPTKSQSAKFYF
jgi:hypothetical protein